MEFKVDQVSIISQVCERINRNIMEFKEKTTTTEATTEVELIET